MARPWKDPLEYTHCPYDGNALGPDYYKWNRLWLERLPVLRREVYETIATKLSRADVLIIEAATGSGKSMGIVPTLCRMFNYEKRILLSEPITIAIEDTAKKLAAQTGLRIGMNCGYQYSRGHKEGEENVFYVVTDFFLIKLFQGDIGGEEEIDVLIRKSKTVYDIIIIDEVHQRNLNIDVMMGVFRNSMKRNGNDKKLIIMSATIDVTKYQKYFSATVDTETMSVQGRTFPMDILYGKLTESKFVDQKKYRNEVARIVTDLLQGTYPIKNERTKITDSSSGNILVFCPTLSFISQLHEEFSGGKKFPKVFFGMIHSGTKFEEKEYIKHNRFVDDGYERQVIFGTNVLETGITIENIRFVIETGISNRVVVDQKTGFKMQYIDYVSQSNAMQRCGRASRSSEGMCITLYTEELFHGKLEKYNKPEILDRPLHDLILTLLGYYRNMRDVLIAIDGLMDKPDIGLLSFTTLDLYRDGMITDGFISDVGKYVMQFGMDYRLGLLIFESFNHNLFRFILPIVALMGIALSIDHLFVDTKKSRAIYETMKNKYGEPIALLRFYMIFSHELLDYDYIKSVNHGIDNAVLRKWADDNGINYTVLKEFIPRMKKILKRANKLGSDVIVRNVSYKRTEYTSQDDRYRVITGIFKRVFSGNQAVYIPKEDKYVIKQRGKTIKGLPRSKFIESKKNAPALMGYTDLVQTSIGVIFSYPFAIIYDGSDSSDLSVAVSK